MIVMPVAIPGRSGNQRIKAETGEMWPTAEAASTVHAIPQIDDPQLMPINPDCRDKKTACPTEISPVNGRSWATISNIETAMPVANTPIAIAEPRRLSI